MSTYAHQIAIDGSEPQMIRIPISSLGSSQMIDLGWSEMDENGYRWGMWRYIKKDYYGNVISDVTERGSVGYCWTEPDQKSLTFWQWLKAPFTDG